VLKTKAIRSNRLETLDHLRGFFIVVIVIDHLWRFPSLFAFISGKALLWVTAAEGFVAISGLLVGYVRGYKNLNSPFKEVAIKLLRRAGLLYVWSLIASIAYVAIIWNIPIKGGFPSTPMPVGDWGLFLSQLITLQYTYTWVYFLTIYAIFLAASPVAIWLFRRNQAWVVALVSFILLIIGWYTKNDILQWQFLFFIPSIVGFYLNTILEWWRGLKRSTQQVAAGTAVTLTITSIVISALLTFYAPAAGAVAGYINNTLFAKDSISLLRAAMAFLWFTGLFFVFYALRHFIGRAFGWLLIPIGTHSLTAYILHGLALCTISYFTIGTENFWINTVLGATSILITWGLVKIPLVRRIIPS
jgi:hypothetical protein